MTVFGFLQKIHLPYVVYDYTGCSLSKPGKTKCIAESRTKFTLYLLFCIQFS